MTADNPRKRLDLLRRFFAGLTEYTFTSRLGVADPPLVDYITTMLVRFVRCENVYGIRSPTGEQFNQVVDMLAEAQARQGVARRRIHRHIGDFTLFWSGMYPEIEERNRRSGSKDSLVDYRSQGKKAYWIASTLPGDRQSTPDDVLQRLSNQFELCVYGLAEVRSQWERREDEPDAPLLFG